MKTDCLRENLIKAMSEQLPPSTNLAKFLSSLLYMGKEAVYRRLRGDVAFSFEEAAVISEKMDVSLDSIVRMCSSSKSLLEPLAMENESAADKYKAILENKLQSFRKILAAAHSEVGVSSNSLPLSMLYRFPGLSKFNFYKWLYQYGVGESIVPYNEFTMPAKLEELQKEYVECSSRVSYAYYIWGDQLFASLIKDIRYFMDMKMLSADDVLEMREEMHALIDNMEKLAAQGGYVDDRRIEMYVSSTNVDSTYMYVDAPSLHLSLIRIFSMDSVISRELHVCNGFKAWIQSQRRTSMLISRSGEPQRVRFFRNQREILNTLSV